MVDTPPSDLAVETLRESYDLNYINPNEVANGISVITGQETPAGQHRGNFQEQIENSIGLKFGNRELNNLQLFQENSSLKGRKDKLDPEDADSKSGFAREIGDLLPAYRIF